MADDHDRTFAARLDRVRASMRDRGIDVTLLSVGADLPWLTGYRAMPLERLTMLVVPVDADATMFVPRLEVPRVVERPDVFTVVGWDETTDPVRLVAEAVGAAREVAIGDQTWARFLVDLLAVLPGVRWRRANDVVGPLRAVKDAAEVASLREAAAAVDRIAAELQSGGIPLIGRTEADVSAELSRRIVAEGHERTNFAIVAAGEHAASPHHHPGDRVIQPGEVVLCDFGGTFPLAGSGVGYCSDITRCVYTGEPPAEFAELYGVLQDAQQRAVVAATVGRPAEEVDAVARERIAEGGFDGLFIHRLGHGIGTEEHEEPYLVEGNREPLVAGNAFSIEPGIYVAGRWGARIEDIVVATTEGPLALNEADHGLAVVDA
ncbi:M24 family metallopeptidase [Actinomarinicola tropica]|uniref:M24 family metallopeptidase n=1 Tax=Actinomarinicola tropica TaxID=2789776 RepID=A0A5Q2RMS0_9ACTN|nr:Xaa-Pro peptidase family protein [Actinomarinicola tropica]QGG95871.1 M24 family metallopeptidase [Actinomarinicola tropica]